MPKRSYPWPASQIHRDVMHELHVASKETGRPITVLIAEAVHGAMNARLDRQPPQPIGFQPPVPPAAAG